MLFCPCICNTDVFSFDMCGSRRYLFFGPPVQNVLSARASGRGGAASVDDGHLQVIFSRAAPRGPGNGGRGLDFACFVDALLWIAVVKYPDADIALAFWRLVTEHVFEMSFVPDKVRALAHAHASARLAKLVLAQGSGRAL